MMKFWKKKTIDSFKQLQRRITFVQFMTPDYFEIQNMILFTNLCPYSRHKKKNTLVNTLKQQNQLNGLETYNKFKQFLDEN